MGIDVFKILVVIFIIIFLIYMTSTAENGSRSFNWRYFTTIPAFLNLLTIILMLISVHKNIKLKNYGTTIQSLVSENSFFVNFFLFEILISKTSGLQKICECIQWQFCYRFFNRFHHYSQTHLLFKIKCKIRTRPQYTLKSKSFLLENPNLRNRLEWSF